MQAQNQTPEQALEAAATFALLLARDYAEALQQDDEETNVDVARSTTDDGFPSFDVVLTTPFGVDVASFSVVRNRNPSGALSFAVLQTEPGSGAWLHVDEAVCFDVSPSR